MIRRGLIHPESGSLEMWISMERWRKGGLSVALVIGGWLLHELTDVFNPGISEIIKVKLLSMAGQRSINIAVCDDASAARIVAKTFTGPITQILQPYVAFIKNDGLEPLKNVDVNFIVGVG